MATKYKGSDSEMRALNAYIALMRASDVVSSRIHRPLIEHDITFGQFAVLEALLHGGAMQTSALARKVLRSGGNVTVVLDNLERRKLVRRERKLSDRRCVVVHLTAEGERLITELFPAHVGRLVAEFEVLSGREQDELRRLCRKLGLKEGGATDESGSVGNG